MNNLYKKYYQQVILDFSTAYLQKNQGYLQVIDRILITFFGIRSPFYG